MSVYKPLIPLPGDNLDDSQGDLYNNFGQLDTTFGIDHFTFSNQTASNGFHSKVTTPAITPIPTTTANPILYSFQDSANAGVLQYSRGTSNSIPTPLTTKQSPTYVPSLPDQGTTNVFDFTGLPISMAILYAGNMATPYAKLICFVLWDGSTISKTDISVFALTSQSSGPILQIKNSAFQTLNNIVWTLQFLRMQ